jgi:hypothetical protein
MKILYRFGDNDFYTTFIEVFRIILRGVELGHIDKERLSNKEYICALINELAYPTYQVMQSHEFPNFKADRFSTELEQKESYLSYFRADPAKIYLNQEVDNLLAVYGDGNHAWFVLDLNQHDTKWQVYAI